VPVSEAGDGEQNVDHDPEHVPSGSREWPTAECRIHVQQDEADRDARREDGRHSAGDERGEADLRRYCDGNELLCLAGVLFGIDARKTRDGVIDRRTDGGEG